MNLLMIEPLEARIAPANLTISPASIIEGDSGTKTMIFTVSLDVATTAPVTVSYATEDITALAGSDYVATSGQVVFAAGDRTKTIEVVINGDLEGEGDETFRLQLSNPINATLITESTTGTILNDAKLSITGPGQVQEGDTGTQNVRFTVNLSEANPTGTAQVNFITVNGSAVAGTDYVTQSGVLSFAVGETSKFVDVVVNGDLTGEQNETFAVQLSSPVGATIATNSAAATILNDDPVLEISGPEPISEGNSGTQIVRYTVTLSNPQAGVSTQVKYSTVDGTATAASNDYVAQMGTLTFGEGETTKFIDVIVNGDQTGEANEAFAVQLSEAVGATILTSSATATILNDDPVFTINSPEGVLEGDEGTKTIRFTVTLTNPNPGATTQVTYATGNGSANASTDTVTGDYIAQTGTLTFEPGETTKFIDVVINGDTVGEIDETFTVTLSNPQNAAVVAGSSVGTGTILNDAKFSIADAPDLLEGDSGTKNLNFTVSLLEANPNATATVRYNTVDGTAVGAVSGQPGDYIIKEGLLTFTPGSTSQTISIAINGDTTGEDDETLEVQLTDATGAAIDDGTAEGTILNDAKLVVTGPLPIQEGNSGTQQVVFTVKLSERKPGETVTVKYETQNGVGLNGAIAGQDYEAVNGTLVFGPDETEKTVAVTVLGDLVKESNETFQFVLSEPENANITTGSASAAIVDDEIEVIVSDVTIAEGDSGTKTMIFTVTLNGPIVAGEKLVLKLSTADLTAVSSGALADYVSLVDQELVFNAGETVKTVTVLVNGDTSFEGAALVNSGGEQFLADQFRLQVTEAKFFTVGSGEEDPSVFLRDAGLAPSSKATGIGTIRDNDVLPTVSIGNTRVLEGNGGDQNVAKFTVTLSQPSDFPITLRYSTAVGTAGQTDFAGATDVEFTIPAGQTSAEVSVPILADDVFEGNEAFTVQISNAKLTAGGTERVLVITQNTGTATIVDDEILVSIDPASPTTIIEGDDGTKDLVINVTLSKAHTAPVVVNYQTQDVTATSTGDRPDYQTATGQIVFAPGQTSQTITIKIIGDTEREGSQDFNLILTADGVELGGAAGRLEQTITIQDEAAEPLPTVTLENLSSAGVNEGGLATFRVSLSAPSNVPVTVKYVLEDGTAVKGATGDYIEPTTLEVVIPAGQTSATFTIGTREDQLSEATETFTVKLAEVTNGAAAPGGDRVVAQILDNDPLPALTVNDVIVVEGQSGTKLATFTIKLSAVAGRDVVVTAATLARDAVGGAAAGAGVDYINKSETLTIAAGQTEATFTVEIVGDTDAELDETFLVQLSNPQNATLARQQAVGTIRADEAAYEILFFNAETGAYDLPDVTVAEEKAGGDTQSISFIVRRTGDLTTAGSVRYTTADGVAVTDIRAAVGSGPRADFTFSSEVVSFAAGAQDSAPVTVQITKDTHYELTEQFRIQLSDPVNGILKVNAENQVQFGKVTITDNDVLPTLTVSDASVTEGNLQGGGGAQQTSMVFKVKLSNVDETGTWNLTRKTIDGTGETGAISNVTGKNDFNALVSADLDFAPGETEKDVVVTVLGDTRDEYDQTFELEVSGTRSDEAAVAAKGTGTIIDDDAEAIVSISDLVTGTSSFTGTTYSEADGFTTSKFFRVTLNVESEKTIKVRYFTQDGPGEYDAKAGEDYVKAGRIEGLASDAGSPLAVLTFAPGTTSQNVSITIINDTIVEGAQGFEVRLAPHSEAPAEGQPVVDVTNAKLGDSRGVAVIADDITDKPVVTINDISLVEGNDPNQTQNARFTISLATPAQRAVILNYATVDGTGSFSGSFADYLATSGQIIFAPGEQVQDVDVQVLNDIYDEGNETFLLNLTGLASGSTDVTFPNSKSSGTATILNGGDSVVGVGISDVRVVENGRNSQNTATFKVELSKAQDTAVTVNAAVRNGTAIRGVDFENKSAAVTIPANQESANFTVAIVSDNVFEPTETFFVDLSGASNGVQIAKGVGQGTIYNDDVRQVNKKTVQWIDLDGDLVTLKISKGTINVLDNNQFSFIEGNSTVGGITLQQLNLNGNSAYQGANISIKAEAQPGFDGDANGVLGDGHVNVGYLTTGAFVGGVFFGLDLGTVKVDGDLGNFQIGDRFVDGLSLKKLDVLSFSTHPEILVRNSDGLQRLSFLQGSVGTIKVRGEFSGIINVDAAQFGNIKSLQIGTLLGDGEENSGVVQFSGTLNKARIGQIQGGGGDGSARIIGDATYAGRIKTLVVDGEFAGGDGEFSGAIQASKISSLKLGSVVGGSGDDSAQVNVDKVSKLIVTDDVIGGQGKRSGVIAGDTALQTAEVKGRLIGGEGEDSGVIRAGKIGSLQIQGGLPTGDDAAFPEITAAMAGGSGESSGRIEVAGTLNSLRIGGAKLPGGVDPVSLQGGAGVESGRITAGKLNDAVLEGDIRGASQNGTATIDIANKIKSFVLKGSLVGGSTRAATIDLVPVAVNTTGALVAGGIGTMKINGDLQSGLDETRVGLQGSGSVGAQGPIGKLIIGGSLIGNENRTVNILAFGEEGVAAIGQLKVGGDVTYANVITGTSLRNTNPGQVVINADAEIRNVKIDGDVSAMNITAGVNAGPDGKFGTADDRLLTGTFGFSDPKVFSRIAKVIIGGQVLGVGDGATKDPFGIVAQHIGSIIVGGNKVPLTSGPGNDTADGTDDETPGVEIAPGTNFRAIELPTP
jgi:hypothetical protein